MNDESLYGNSEFPDNFYDLKKEILQNEDLLNNKMSEKKLKQEKMISNISNVNKKTITQKNELSEDKNPFIKIEPENVIQGIIFSEILGKPRCFKQRFR